MEKAHEEIADYLCELDRKVNQSKAPFKDSNAERRAMFLAQAEDLLRACPSVAVR